jgi:hypothetical protein
MSVCTWRDVDGGLRSLRSAAWVRPLRRGLHDGCDMNVNISVDDENIQEDECVPSCTLNISASSDAAPAWEGDGDRSSERSRKVGILMLLKVERRFNSPLLSS